MALEGGGLSRFEMILNGQPTDVSSPLDSEFTEPLLVGTIQSGEAEGGGDTKADSVAGRAKANASLRGTVFNLTNQILGAGVLSVPFALFLDGSALGTIMIILVACEFPGLSHP
jgi:hypothetical protein